jgi:hypothetical protein
MIEKSEGKMADENLWDEIVLRDERYILQVDVREAGTMLTMLGSNLGNGSDLEDTINQCIKVCEKIINKWQRIEK